MFKPLRNLHQWQYLQHIKSNSKAIELQKDSLFFYKPKLNFHITSIYSLHWEGRNEHVSVFHPEIIPSVTKAVTSSSLCTVALGDIHGEKLDPPTLYTVLKENLKNIHASVIQRVGVFSSVSTSLQATTWHRLNIFYLK